MPVLLIYRTDSSGLDVATIDVSGGNVDVEKFLTSSLSMKTIIVVAC